MLTITSSSNFYEICRKRENLQQFLTAIEQLIRNLDECCSIKEPSNSERSEECIDFTMIITSRNNAPISNYGGGFRCKNEYLWCIIEVKS
ncbi:Uncharacterized protein FWK35_00004742 [Aphis craccivora]|uniref:Uncharacterized protein n=1 Tax=Aphis craccivora TaxID=307492 RepID=A0A6G0ZIH2_APHCR|nr:Uncharacterized protein FWK35_00004742 [Aphis craccivora]